MYDPAGNIHFDDTLVEASHACELTSCPLIYLAFVAYISKHERNKRLMSRREGQANAIIAENLFFRVSLHLMTLYNIVIVFKLVWDRRCEVKMILLSMFVISPG